MNNYILADIKRIFRKKSFLMMIGIYILLFFSMIFIYFNPTFTADNYVTKTKTFLGFFPLLIGLIVFLSVYYDDFKSKCMQVAIGYGLPRYKVVLSKFIESFLLLFIISLFVTLIIIITPNLLGISLNNSQLIRLLGIFITELLKTVGYISISTIPLFYTENTVLGTIFYVLLSSRTVMIFLNMFLSQDFLIQAFGDLKPYLLTSQLSKINILFIKTGTISIDLLWTILIYIVSPNLLSMFGFDKKELEF